MTDYEHIYDARADDYDRLVSAEDCDGALLPAILAVAPLSGKDVVEVGATMSELAMRKQDNEVMEFARPKSQKTIARNANWAHNLLRSFGWTPLSHI